MRIILVYNHHTMLLFMLLGSLCLVTGLGCWALRR